MHIDRLVLGAYENNCYIIRDSKKAADCIIIDTGLSSTLLIDFLRKNNLNPQTLILTHGHGDHIAGITSLRNNFGQIKVCIHKADSHMLSNARDNLSVLVGAKITAIPADILLDKEEQIEYADISLQIIHTPGHSPGGICLYNKDEKILFSGDTLFAGSVGRTDFPGYDTEKCMAQLISNIKNKLLVLPEDTKVLPGHGESTTIRQEKLYNPYLH